MTNTQKKNEERNDNCKTHNTTLHNDHNFKQLPIYYYVHEILLDCGQSNVLPAKVFFSSLSPCIRDPASIKDPSNTILIVTVTGL